LVGSPNTKHPRLAVILWMFLLWDFSATNNMLVAMPYHSSSSSAICFKYTTRNEHHIISIAPPGERSFLLEDGLAHTHTHTQAIVLVPCAVITALLTIDLAHSACLLVSLVLVLFYRSSLLLLWKAARPPPLLLDSGSSRASCGSVTPLFQTTHKSIHDAPGQEVLFFQQEETQHG
jgi:hypothetical protein